MKTRLLRFGFNHFPAFRRTGARISYIAADFREVLVKLPLNWKTRDYVGTMFGGSMYGAVDGICMVMLIKLLAPITSSGTRRRRSTSRSLGARRCTRG